MAIRVSGKNLDIGDSLRSQINARVEAAIAKYAEGRGSGHVTVQKDGIGFRTECVVSLGSGMTLEAAGAAPDAYVSFDQAADRMEKRLRRYKRRISDRLGAANGHGAAGGDGPGEGTPQSSYSILEAPEADGVDDADFHPVVIAETTRPMNRLSVSEAVVELDLTGSPVVVFRHAGNGRVNVVYRRNDGSIGWVDPPAADS